MSPIGIPKLYPALPDGAFSAAPAAEPSFLSFVEQALEGADATERAFTHGRGGLQEMVVERAQADVALSIASATASRATQALTMILGMQV
jgi:flagellar hook-basal body complex protein FliE